MKVGIKKLDGVIGDMELVKKQTVSYETMYRNKLRTTTEFVYRIELIFEMSDGSTHVSNAYVSRFAYKPAGSVLGRYPIDDLAKFHEALGKLVIQDLDVKKHPGRGCQAVRPLLRGISQPQLPWPPDHQVGRQSPQPDRQLTAAKPTSKPAVASEDTCHRR